MHNIYRGFCRIEEIFTSVVFVSIVVLIFSAAFFRVFDRPIVWADDIAKFLFSWAAFLGADIALRHSRLVGVDILVNKLPRKAAKITELAVFIIMIIMLAAFVYFGTMLSIKNIDRSFQTLSFMSYSFVTASLPTASLLMIISASIKIGKIINHFDDDSYEVLRDNPDSTVESI
jgi:TRAP-type C4-dicarboxylate transport system permease small subunit